MNSNDEHTPLDEIIQKNTSRFVREIYTFFGAEAFARDRGADDINVIDQSAGRAYCIPHARADTMFDLLDACRRDSRSTHYAEPQRGMMGLSLDIVHDQPGRDPVITGKQIKTFCSRLSQLLRSTLVGDNDLCFYLFVTRCPAPVLVGSSYRDTLRVIVPELQVSRAYKHYIHTEIERRNDCAAAFRELGTQHPRVESPLRPCPFYGCARSGTPLQLHACWRMTASSYGDVDFEDVPIAQLLGGARPATVDGRTVDAAPINLCYEMSLGHSTPTFDGRATWLQKRVYDAKVGLPEAPIDDDQADPEITNTYAKLVRELLNMLTPDYVTDHAKWSAVVLGVSRCGQSSDFRAVLREFTEQHAQDRDVDAQWSLVTNRNYKADPIGISSLRMWARQCSPEAYRAFEENAQNTFLQRQTYINEGSIGHAVAARMLHMVCSDKFVCDMSEHPSGRVGYCWYEFVMPGQAQKRGEVYKWRKEYDPDNMHLFIGEHMAKIYGPVRDILRDHRENADTKDLEKYWGRVEKFFRSSMTRLQDNGYQRSVIEQARYMFRRRGFSDELDSYEDIIGVGNGVLKLGAHPVLLTGYHEYNISKFTETDYYPYDESNPFINELLNAFRDTFPEPDVFDFMMMHASTGLDLRESACILLLMVGGGQNGKSFFLKMVHNTLGNEYCASGKPALLTSPAEKAGDANSAQMQQRDKRYFYFEEFNRCEHLNTARVKAIVTPTWQTGRDLYAKQGCFKNTSNPIAASNFRFVIDTTDHGTWRRIYLYNNKVKFCANPDPTNPFEKRENARLIDECTNDPRYKEAMLSIMTEYNRRLHTMYGGDLKRVPVPTIMRESAEFRNSQDSINLFITQMIVVSPQAEPIQLVTVANAFIAWYSRTIRHCSQSSIEAAAGFENSRISSAIVRRINGVQFLHGHRVKSTADDPLEPGESELISDEERHANRVIMNKLDKNAPIAPVDNTATAGNAAPANNAANDNVDVGDIDALVEDLIVKC